MARTGIFSHRIQAERNRLGLTQTEFGRAAGVTRATQAKYESGRSVPDLEYVVTAAESGIDVDYLLTSKTARQRSNDLFDWELAHELVLAIHQVADELKLDIPPSKLMPLVRLLYKLVVLENADSPSLSQVKELLKVAA